VNSKQLILQIIKKLQKARWIIIGAGLLLATIFFVLFGQKPISFTAKTTLFPLTSPTDNAISNSMLNGILGLGDAPKSFSNEATINIIELALSRRIRESVAMTQLPQFGNKTIAQLLLEEDNNHKSLWAKSTPASADSLALAIAGGELLKPVINAKMSKNGVLELYYTGTRKAYITPISNVLIDKLSKFYVDLKRQKALDDYNFTLDKIDSLQKMINTVDKQAIGLQQTTMFTPNELLEYNIPKVNVSSEKTRILRQRDMYINNRDEAVWRLQKVTPIIAVLDKPTEPFQQTKPQRVLFIILGFVAGAAIATFLLLARQLWQYAKAAIKKSILA
jgi:hypothetical protein